MGWLAAALALVLSAGARPPPATGGSSKPEGYREPTPAQVAAARAVASSLPHLGSPQCRSSTLCRNDTGTAVAPEGFYPSPPSAGVIYDPGTNRVKAVLPAATRRADWGRSGGVGTRVQSWGQGYFVLEVELPYEVELRRTTEQAGDPEKEAAMVGKALGVDRWHGTVELRPRGDRLFARSTAPAGAYGEALANARRWVAAGGAIPGTQLVGVAVPRKWMTVIGRKDAFGSQVTFVWAAIAWSSRHGIPFCHSRWQELEFNTYIELQYLEIFGGLTAIPPCPSWPGNGTRKDRDQWIDNNFHTGIQRGRPLNMLVTYVTHFLEEYFDPRTRVALAALYWATPKPQVFPPHSETGIAQIACHFRAGRLGRGVGAGLAKLQGFRHVLKYIVDDFEKKGMKSKLHFFTLEASTDGPGGPPCPCGEHERHSDWPIAKTFHAFVTADVVVMDRSTFSWLPAIIAKGTVYYPIDSFVMKAKSWKGQCQGGEGPCSAFKSGLKHWRTFDIYGKDLGINTGVR